MAQIEAVRQAKTIYQSKLLARPNVVGLGTAYKVVAGQATPRIVPGYPGYKKGFFGRSGGRGQNSIKDRRDYNGRYRSRASGCLRPQTGRCRPAEAGVSLGHYKITAGTFGCVVHDRQSNSRLILSNNHVLANSNDGLIGDPILQPGAVDGGTQANDILAFLTRFHPDYFWKSARTTRLAEASPAACPAIAPGNSAEQPGTAESLGTRSASTRPAIT